MRFENTITFDDVKKLVDDALTQFYSNDSMLFNYKSEGLAISERCMTFHIGWYMMQSMKERPEFKLYSIDCEYNRNLQHPKSMYKETLAGVKEKIKDAIPDLIIHERGNNKNNLLLIEFKKGNPSAEDRKNDEEKLEYFTHPENEYKYKFGFYIKLCKQKVRIDIFENGKAMGDKYYELNY